MPALQKETEDPGLLKDMINRGIESGELVRLSSELFMHRESWDQFLGEFRKFAENRGQFEIQDVKAVFPLARKYLIPMLEFLDGAGITAKEGTGRKLIR